MKLLVHNLGRIEQAELDIRPLTVLMGKNSTNKTWTVYSFYGLLRYLTWRTPAIVGVRSMGKNLIEIQTEPVRSQVLSAVEKTMARLPAGEEVGTVEIEVSRNGLLESIEEPARFTLRGQRLRQLLRLDAELAPDAGVTLQVEAEELRRRDVTASMHLRFTERSLRMHWTSGEPETFISVQLGSDAAALRNRAASLLHAFAQRFLSMGSVLLLPAERKALASTYHRVEDDGPIEGVLSGPVTDYTRFLKSADALWRIRSEMGMSAALDHLDARILGGTIRFQEQGSARHLVFVPNSGPALPMHATSSMVRSLAGLDLHLRNGARAGDILIIDEPEMNAHPEAQVALLELLGYLVNQGIRIVLTTHNAYIVEHLNNLIWARKLSEGDQDKAANSFRLQTKEAFLRAEDVAAYVFEAEDETAPVRVRSVFSQDDPEGLIDWETFSRTSRYLDNLYGREILPRLFRKD